MTSSAARVLVATDSPADASNIVRQLEDWFLEVRSSSEPARAVADFDAFRPDVLVLAFSTIERAQSYELELYRMSVEVVARGHATVLLCDKDSVPTAFKLCTKGIFDDYVLFWPQAHDGYRLAMTTLNASRVSTTRQGALEDRAQMLSHAQSAGAVESLVTEHLDSSERTSADLRRRLGGAHATVTNALDRLSGGLAAPSASPAALQVQLDAIRREAIEPALRATAAAAAPTIGAFTAFRSRLEPHFRRLQAAQDALRRRQCVLVVEDSELDRKIIERALGGQPYRLCFAEDGAAAVAIIRQRPPDLILMDVNLPDINGLDLVARLKTLPWATSIPVVMLTSESRTDVVQRSKAAGAAGFIVKPFTQAALTEKLGRLLSGAVEPQRDAR
jgi:CheY-like chemotaxis protein